MPLPAVMARTTHNPLAHTNLTAGVDALVLLSFHDPTLLRQLRLRVVANDGLVSVLDWV